MDEFESNNRVTILLVSGDNQLVMELAKTLSTEQSKGYHIKRVIDFQQAGTILKKSVFDIIFVDAALPQASSHLHKLRLLYQDMITIVITERAYVADFVISETNKIDRFLIKPVKQEQVQIALRIATKKSKQINQSSLAEERQLAPASKIHKYSKNSLLVSLLLVMIVVTSLVLILTQVNNEAEAEVGSPDNDIVSIFNSDRKELAEINNKAKDELFTIEAEDSITLSSMKKAMNIALNKGQKALEAGRYSEPEKNNALYYFKQVLILESGNEIALQGLETVNKILLSSIHKNLKKGNFKIAEKALYHVYSIQPDHPQFRILQMALYEAWQSSLIASAKQKSEQGEFKEALTLLDEPEVRKFNSNQIQDVRYKIIKQEQKTIQLEILLTQIKQSMAEGTLLNPADQNAKYYLLQAKKIEPKHQELKALEKQLSLLLIEQANLALSKQDISAAKTLLKEAKTLEIDSTQIAKTEAMLKTVLAKQKQVSSANYLELAKQRLQEKKLITPENDNAGYYFALAETEYPSKVRQGRNDLHTLLLQQITVMLNNGELEQAEYYFRATKDLGFNTIGLKELENSLQFAKQERDALENPVGFNELDVINYSPPKYPRIALKRGIEGWVHIDFIIDKKGQVKDLKIIDAKPANKFEKTTMSTAKLWKFKPKYYNGIAMKQRATMRVRFEIEKDR